MRAEGALGIHTGFTQASALLGRSGIGLLCVRCCRRLMGGVLLWRCLCEVSRSHTSTVEHEEDAVARLVVTGAVTFDAPDSVGPDDRRGLAGAEGQMR